MSTSEFEFGVNIGLVITSLPTCPVGGVRNAQAMGAAICDAVSVLKTASEAQTELAALIMPAQLSIAAPQGLPVLSATSL